MNPVEGNVEAIPAASVLVLRDEPFEVLMLRRNDRSSFVPGTWVFPGGIAEAQDYRLAAVTEEGNPLPAMKVTALRETFEETGIWLGSTAGDHEEKRRRLLEGTASFEQLAAGTPLDLDSLVPTSRWITPVGLPKRFDTWFFLAAVDRHTEATAEMSEAMEVRWVTPAAALELHRSGQMKMVFPTIRNLDAIAGYASARELIAARRGAVIEPVLPVLVDGKPTLR